MKKKLLVKQRDIRDCGACCLLSILRFYDGDFNIEQIRLDTKTNNNGTTAYNIINAAKRYGLNGYGIRTEKLDDNLSLPVIAHIVTKKGYEHFVVIYKITKKKILIMDPASGFKNVDIKEFLEEWDNITLVLRPYKRIIKNSINNSLMNFIIVICKKEKKLFYKLLIDSIFITLLSLFATLYWQFTFSYNNSINKYFLYISLFFLLITILKNITIRKKNYWQIVFNKKIDTKLVLSFIEQVFKLPLDIIRNRTSGEIITRINEIKEIKDLFANLLITLLLEFFLAICSMYILLLISPKLFIVVIIIITLYLFIAIITSSSIYKRINNIIESETDFNASLGENIERINTITNLNIKGFIMGRIQKSFYEYQSENFTYANFLNNYLSLRNLIYDIGLIIINTYGIFLIYDNRFTLIKLITFNTVLSYILNPFTDIADSIPKISMVKLAIVKINELLSIKVKENGDVEEFSNGLISFKDIGYSYDDYHMVLNNININIEEGERLLIKGKSGIGKSTLLQLLNGNIENYKGRILINGINIKDYSMATIRKNIRYVSQKEGLFTGTIKDNIIFDKKYNIDYLNEIIQITKLNEILDKKELRLNTLIVDGGANVSGGEKQRIVLARAIIDKPPILILDEALSEVDEQLEMAILNNLNTFLADSTIIYISHHNSIDGFKIFKLEEAT